MKKMQIDKCKSCGAAIVWALSSTTGKRMPVDAEPTKQGNVILSGDSPDLSARVQGGPLDDGSGHLSHFVTCPQRDQWRRKGR